MNADKNLLEQLEGMGFATAHATKALLETKNQGLDSAIEYLISRKL